jgi:hypothetical protein
MKVQFIPASLATIRSNAIQEELNGFFGQWIKNSRVHAIDGYDDGMTRIFCVGELKHENRS